MRGCTKLSGPWHSTPGEPGAAAHHMLDVLQLSLGDWPACTGSGLHHGSCCGSRSHFAADLPLGRVTNERLPAGHFESLLSAAWQLSLHELLAQCTACPEFFHTRSSRTMGLKTRVLPQEDYPSTARPKDFEWDRLPQDAAGTQAQPMQSLRCKTAAASGLSVVRAHVP